MKIAAAKETYAAASRTQKSSREERESGEDQQMVAATTQWTEMSVKTIDFWNLWLLMNMKYYVRY